MGIDDDFKHIPCFPTHPFFQPGLIPTSMDQVWIHRASREGLCGPEQPRGRKCNSKVGRPVFSVPSSPAPLLIIPGAQTWSSWWQLQELNISKTLQWSLLSDRWTVFKDWWWAVEPPGAFTLLSSPASPTHLLHLMIKNCCLWLFGEQIVESLTLLLPRQTKVTGTKLGGWTPSSMVMHILKQH